MSTPAAVSSVPGDAPLPGVPWPSPVPAVAVLLPERRDLLRGLRSVRAGTDPGTCAPTWASIRCTAAWCRSRRRQRARLRRRRPRPTAGGRKRVPRSPSSTTRCSRCDRVLDQRLDVRALPAGCAHLPPSASTRSRWSTRSGGDPADRRGMVIRRHQACASLSAIVCAIVVPFLRCRRRGAGAALAFVGTVPLVIIAIARRTCARPGASRETPATGRRATARSPHPPYAAHRARVFPAGGDLGLDAVLHAERGDVLEGVRDRRARLHRRAGRQRARDRVGRVAAVPSSSSARCST